MFPGYIRSLDDALAHIDDWARAMGGQRVNGIETMETQRGAMALKPFDIEFVGGHVLTVSATSEAYVRALVRRIADLSGGHTDGRPDPLP